MFARKFQTREPILRPVVPEYKVQHREQRVANTPTELKKLEISAHGAEADFEIQKLGEQNGLVVAYVGPETLERLREGVPKGSDLTLYSNSWKDAPNVVGVPFNGLEFIRSRLIHPQRMILQALDCKTR